MIGFKESFAILTEKKMKLPSGENLVKEFSKLGKKKNVDAVITSKGSSFTLYVDGVELDKFKSQKDAEKNLSEFIKVMGV